MNQFVVDFGAGTAAEGDEVVLFGPGDSGEPTVQEWADALGTISYEIATRFGGRTPRSYSGVAFEEDPVHAGAGAEVTGTFRHPRVAVPPRDRPSRQGNTLDGPHLGGRNG